MGLCVRDLFEEKDFQYVHIETPVVKDNGY